MEGQPSVSVTHVFENGDAEDSKLPEQDADDKNPGPNLHTQVDDGESKEEKNSSNERWGVVENNCGGCRRSQDKTGGRGD